MLRDDQLALLRWVLEAAGPATTGDVPPLPELDLPRLQRAGIATGLTAAVGALAARRGVPVPDAWREFVTEQVDAVAARRQRYTDLLPRALAALAADGIPAVPVKGAVLADAVWPVPDARPMADIDLLVRPADQALAVRSLERAGMSHHAHTADEDVLLAWGDGSRGPTDRESAGHNGKVEVHPGWRERVHNYSVDGGAALLAATQAGTVAGAPCRVLPPHALAVHALGHLSIGAIRAEVRAVNVVDVALAVHALDAGELVAFERLRAAVDPRLTAPGLWLVASTRPSWFDAPWFDTPEFDAMVEAQLARLPRAAREALHTAAPQQVLRELGARTSVRWRLAFATTAVERAAVVRQAVSPSATELATAGGGGQGVWRLQAARVARAARRVVPRSHPPSSRPVVYVLAGDPGDVAPAATFGRWPTAGRTLGELARAGVYVVGVARTSFPSERIEHEGVAWHFVRDRSRVAWRVAGEVRRQRPYLVHANGTGFSLAWLAIRLRCGWHVPIVVQHHGEPPGTGWSLLVQRLVRRRTQGYLFTGGAAQAAPFADAGVLTDSTPVFDVLESSADVEPLDPIAARARTGMTGAPAVIAVGRLVDAKDPVVVASTFCAFAAECAGAELWWLYHDDRMERAVRAVLSEHPAVADRVHLIGRVAPEAMGAWLSGADVFLSASRHEGSGYALIEAIRCGCTPVVSDIAPHRAICGPLGTQFPAGDVALGAAALHDVVVDRDGAAEWFAAALSWESVADQLRAVYDQW